MQSPIDVTWRDMKFAIGPPDGWLLMFSHFAEREQVTRAVEAMLGADQYQQFIDAGPKLTDLQVLIGSAMSGFGLDQGKH